MVCELFEENIRIELDLFDSDLLRECFKIIQTKSILGQLFKSSTSEKEGMFWPKLLSTLKEKNWAKVKTDEDSWAMA